MDDPLRDDPLDDRLLDEWEDLVQVPTWGDLMFRHLPERGDVDLLVFPDRRVSYAEFARSAMDRARALIAAGVGPGDHVGILLPSSVEHVEMVFATALVGAVAVVINSRYRSHELGFVVENADIRLLVVAGEVADEVDYAERLCEALPELTAATDPHDLALAGAPHLREVVILDEPRPGFVGGAEFVAGAASVTDLEVHRRRHGIRLRDPLLLMYTSGTTSMPKGCLLSHEAVVRTAQIVSKRFDLRPSDRYWSPLPLFHFGALQPLAATMIAGGTFICMPRFEAGQALQILEEERASVAFLGFPAIINDLIGHPDKGSRDLTSLRCMMSSAAVQPKAVQDALRAAFPGVVQIGMYAMTESSAAGTCTGYLDGAEAGIRAVGRPLQGMNLRIVREDGSDAECGEIGEIQFNGFGMMDGYYRQPEVTSESYAGAWFRSGDLGTFNEHGELVFHGRSKEMLKIGGENVAPAEIEEYIHRHPAVKLCQVVPAPDDRMAEVAVAFIELHDGHELSADDVIEFCNGRIASFKVPRHVRFVTEWPLTASSKVQKQALADRILGELGAL